MPSKRNDENLTFQKSEALFGLIKELRDERIPQSTHEAPASERFLSSGKIIELLGDEYQRLPDKAMRDALQEVGLTQNRSRRFNLLKFYGYMEEMYEKYDEYIHSLPASYFTRHKKASDFPTQKPTLPETTEEPELPPEESELPPEETN